MKFGPFPKNFQKKRSARKRRVEFCSQESLFPGGYNNMVKYYVRVMSSQCVSGELESLAGPEERELLDGNCGIGEVSAGRISNELKRTHASLKSRKRKNKKKDESGDSEEIIPSRIRCRGQARRALDSSNTGSTERTKLDSATFLHYFMHIWNDFSEEKLKSVAFFDPLWFNLYADERNRSMVLDWIKGIGIFLKKYVLVPIVLWSHWSLLIFCNLGECLDSENGTPCLLLLDSLHAIGPKRLEPLIRRLLSDIYKIEGRTETREQLKKMPLLIPKVPQQKKGDECGYVVLCYVSLFVECAPEKFSTSNGYPYFMNKDWFTVEGLESFYKRLDSVPPVSNDHDDTASMDSGACVETISADKSRGNAVICLD
ncbi:probable ubiquitin-like-specific protease 2A isoform X5 [Primulina huaijiensis]|uniref:probable ubiquitin-like-specific protease 2A isoform X5 n=1 Tax=Primulina huaijiensis TaxID=1492673 RepID=UPI003CC77F06